MPRSNLFTRIYWQEKQRQALMEVVQVDRTPQTPQELHRYIAEKLKLNIPKKKNMRTPQRSFFLRVGFLF